MSRRQARRSADRSELEFVLDVLRVEPGATHIIRTLARRYGGCFVHYKDRSRYCPGKDDCQFHKLDRTWKGYAAVEEWDADRVLWCPTVLEITEGLDADMLDKFDRGQVWEIKRLPQVKKGKATPVYGRLLEERDPDTFPHEFDIKPVLCRVYHVTEIRLDQKNPMPPRQVVTGSPGAPPISQPAKEGHKANPVTEEHIRQLRDLKGRVGGMQTGNGSKN